jgi:hypothetical protein
MNAFLESLRADLLDRRMRPLVALLGVALLGALAYAAFGGSSSSTPPAGSPPVAQPTGAIALSPVKTEGTQAIAETTGGSDQTGGATRNPFTPLPQPKATQATASTSTAAGSSAGSSSSSSSSSPSSSPSSTPGSSTGGAGAESGAGTESGSSGGSAPAESKPAPPPSKPKTFYKVSALFGAAPPATPLANAQLTAYDKLKLQQPLPSATQPLVVFRGVVAGGKSATFTLVGEAIIRGSGACRPSPAQCQVIDLQKGQTEELEYVPLGAAPTTYMLHIVDIKAVKAKAAAKARASDAHAATSVGESPAGLRLLREAGRQAIPGMRYSSTKGVLVFTAALALQARAHIATVHELSLLQ